MQPPRPSQPLDELDPFGSGGGAGPGGDLDRLREEARRCAVDKIREISELRRTVLERDRDRIARCAGAMAAAFAAGGRLFTFGNGGSATDAAGLAGMFADPGPDRRAVPAYALTGDAAVLTALADDVGVDVIFARQLAAAGRPGDIVVGLSTSGNSTNLLSAFDAAKRAGMVTVGLSGYGGGAMASLASIDHHFVVPSASVHRIQEAQRTVCHVLWELTLAALAEPVAGEMKRGDHDA